MFFLAFAIVSGCSRETLPDPDTIPPDMEVDGLWKRGENSTIRIGDFRAEIIGANGAVIWATVEYFSNGTILITERGHTPEFIANYVPLRVAQIIYTNDRVTNSRFRLRKSDEDRVDVQVFAWQVYFDTAQDIYMVTPYTGKTEWVRIKEEEE